MEAILQEAIRQALPETFWEYLKGVRFHMSPGLLTVIVPDLQNARTLASPHLWPDVLDSVGCDRLVITDQAGFVCEVNLEICVEWQNLLKEEWESMLRWVLFLGTVPDTFQERLGNGISVHPRGNRIDLYAEPELAPDVLPMIYWLVGVEAFGFHQVRIMESCCKPRLTLSMHEIRRLVRYGFNRLTNH